MSSGEKRDPVSSPSIIKQSGEDFRYEPDTTTNPKLWQVFDREESTMAEEVKEDPLRFQISESSKKAATI
jgi:hypothetical protein